MNLKEKFSDLTELVKEPLGKVYDKLDDNLPGILIIGGVIGLVAAGVIACVESADVKEAIEETEKDIQQLEENKSVYIAEIYTTKELVIEDVKICGRIVARFGKKYGLSFILYVLSIISILSGYNIIHCRYISLLATCAAIEKAYAHYREEIIKRYGTDIDDEIRLGLAKVTIETPVLDKNGNPKLDKNGLPRVTKETLEIVDPDHVGDYSPYAFVWNRFNPDGTENNSWFEGSIEENRNHVARIQKQLDQQLKSSFGGSCEYNHDLLAPLDMPKKGIFMRVGWKMDDEKRRIMANSENPDRMLVNLRARVVNLIDGRQGILIDPNVDGDISSFLDNESSYGPESFH